jgi:hypothetical protein
MEGFSSEEGFPEMFGTTEFEGHANLGVAVVQSDGSWAAKIPPNIPVHLQAVDVYGMSIFNEPVWFSGRAGEARVCGGCHESRTKTTNVQPGLLEAFVSGNNSLFGTTPRAQRVNKNPVAATDLVGIGWDTQVQPILDAKCVSCHGNDNKAGIAPYTITDPTGVMAPVTWTFNLTGGALPASLGVAAGGGSFSASYFSMAGPDREAIEKAHLMISGNFKVYLNPEDAHGSIAIQKVNPTQLFPTPGTARAFPSTPHLLDPTIATKTGVALPADLTAREFYTLTLSADMGGNFYARENNPGLSIY